MPGNFPTCYSWRKNWLKIWKSVTALSTGTVTLCSSKPWKTAARQTAELESWTSGDQTWTYSETCLAASCRRANKSRWTCWSSGRPRQKYENSPLWCTKSQTSMVEGQHGWTMEFWLTTDAKSKHRDSGRRSKLSECSTKILPNHTGMELGKAKFR